MPPKSKTKVAPPPSTQQLRAGSLGILTRRDSFPINPTAVRLTNLPPALSPRPSSPCDALRLDGAFLARMVYTRPAAPVKGSPPRYSDDTLAAEAIDGSVRRVVPPRRGMQSILGICSPDDRALALALARSLAPCWETLSTLSTRHFAPYRPLVFDPIAFDCTLDEGSLPISPPPFQSLASDPLLRSHLSAFHLSCIFFSPLVPVLVPIPAWRTKERSNSVFIFPWTQSSQPLSPSPSSAAIMSPTDQHGHDAARVYTEQAGDSDHGGISRIPANFPVEIKTFCVDGTSSVGNHVCDCIHLREFLGSTLLCSRSCADRSRDTGIGAPPSKIKHTIGCGTVAIAGRHIVYGDTCDYGTYHHTLNPKQRENRCSLTLEAESGPRVARWVVTGTFHSKN
ncbi:hypothetical protein MVEN_00129700 [Mycena venus]|uniref:Uncharacterized protein n=1 Tax=Mycena venus TaxID=2733690 RepID=A0A8H6Z8P2_9AGAR|nr:hypothetical protein MVEN_00129700 [Mycena venus]